MSEGRNGSESREYGYTPSYSNYASESRDSGESRTSYARRQDCSSESRDLGESRPSYSVPSESRMNFSDSNESRDIITSESISQNVQTESSLKDSKYNNLDDIDKLIDELEQNFPIGISSNARYNQALDKRKKQIEELKMLRDEAMKIKEEEQEILKFEQQNDEIDAAINDIKSLLKNKRQF